MDFDDLMLHPLRLFREHADVLERWQHRFDFVMVDEFQDTNRAQYQLVRYLGAHHHNVFAVGDEDQSIYAWRGADLRNMNDLLHDFGDGADRQAGRELPLHPADSRRRQRSHRPQRGPHRQDAAPAAPGR